MTLILRPDITKSPLRSLRRAVDMSLRQLSKATDDFVPVVAISEIERGKRPPTDIEWEQLWPVLEWRMMVALGLRKEDNT